MIVGLTGGIGSGKTTVVNMFKEFGVDVFVADVEAKKLMQTSSVIKKEIIKAFGEASYVDGTLNRSFISDIVFRNKEQLKILNAIVHPRLKAHFKKFVERKHSEYIVYEAAILFESGSASLCDYIVTVTAPLDIRISRVIERDASTKQEVFARIKHQLEDSFKIKNAHFVVNNTLLSGTKSQTYTIHNLLVKLLNK